MIIQENKIIIFKFIILNHKSSIAIYEKHISEFS
jgi:hypothetical protein